jgi:hypothetical protein
MMANPRTGDEAPRLDKVRCPHCGHVVLSVSFSAGMDALIDHLGYAQHKPYGPQRAK